VQVLELIILGVLAAVVLFQLYAVLGRRIGRGPGDLTPTPVTGAPEQPMPLPAPTGDATAVSGLAAVRARDPSFDVAHFLQGARGAYQVIAGAFASGDRAALKPLLAPQVLENFEAEMTRRETEGHNERIEFPQQPRADLESIDIKGDIAHASVRFLAEIRSRLAGPQGETSEERRTAEVWTFERNLKSRDPNWKLIHVDAAEA
jgi:predicted lipid-binding transport protein (Tim44 family)